MVLGGSPLSPRNVLAWTDGSSALWLGFHGTELCTEKKNRAWETLRTHLSICLARFCFLIYVRVPT